jgi:GNAT superfamily N-acetyltransferase
MNDLQRKAEVLTMMHGLYSEDPSHGRIVLFGEGASLRGYALLVPYWSNEFGGTLVVVDELFVTPRARNRGIARSFFRFLGEERPFEAVALALEVSPANTGARRLNESVGFTCRRNSLITYRFPEK